MKLHFEPDIDYQRDAINAVCDLFHGQEICRTEFTVTQDTASNLFLPGMQNDLGIGNRLILLNDELLANLGLTDKADANMRQLSGGMKRRVLVAQALVHRPRVIVLDEPTAGVDVELRQTLWQFIAKLNKEGHTVLLTTHYLEEAEALCNRIAMIKQGELVALDRTSGHLASGRLPDRRPGDGAG